MIVVKQKRGRSENMKYSITPKDMHILSTILMADDIVLSINKNLKTLIQIIPEIEDMIGFEHKNPNHHLDVWQHTVLALSMAPKTFEIRLILLLHDIGKPHCFTEGEIRHFKGHEKVSAEISRNILNRIEYPSFFIDEVCNIIQEHDTKITKEEIATNYDLAYKKFLVQSCDALAHSPEGLPSRKEYIEKTEKVLKRKKNRY